MNKVSPDGSRLYEVYMLSNKATGKSYIGITCSGLRKRMYAHESCARLGSQKPIHRAIRKHGIGGFEVTLLAHCFGLDAANATEIELIDEYKTFGIGGYNATKGGDGVKGLSPNKFRREQIGKQFRELKRTPEHCQRISAALKGKPKPHMVGRPSANRGVKQDLVRKAASLEALAKAVDAWKGSTHGIDARRAMRETKSYPIQIRHPDGRTTVVRTTLSALAQENGISTTALSNAMRMGRMVAKGCGLKGCTLQRLDANQ